MNNKIYSPEHSKELQLSDGITENLQSKETLLISSADYFLR